MPGLAESTMRPSLVSLAASDLITVSGASFLAAPCLIKILRFNRKPCEIVSRLGCGLGLRRCNAGLKQTWLHLHNICCYHDKPVPQPRPSAHYYFGAWHQTFACCCTTRHAHTWAPVCRCIGLALDSTYHCKRESVLREMFVMQTGSGAARVDT